MAEYLLSYILTTYNKFEYLKITLPLILENVREGEEVVVADGGSTDGTVEYLEDLFRRGLINQFVSGKDSGEAHGFNKGILMAKGEFIKPISDDDLFDLDPIRQCVSSMKKDGSIDLMGTGGIYCEFSQEVIARSSLASDEQIVRQHFLDKGPFFISGLGVIFRRSSVAKMGLYSVIDKRVDEEFWLRNSANPFVKIAYAKVNGYCWVPNSNSISYSKGLQRRIMAESYWLPYYYANRLNDQFYQRPVLNLVKLNWRWFLRFRNTFLKRKQEGAEDFVVKALPGGALEKIYEQAHAALKNSNKDGVCTIISS